jgi:hypothetical protein
VTPTEPYDVARIRRALRALRDEDGPSGDAGRIFEAVHGDLPIEERRAVVDELVHDPGAAEAWALAKELAPVLHATSVGHEPAHRHQATGRWQWLAIAASVILAAGLAWQFAGHRQVNERPVYRSLDQRRIDSALPPDVPLPRAKPVLRWTAIAGARYHLRVLTSGLDVLEEVPDLGAPEHALSADTIRQLPPGAQLLWQVEAHMPGTASLLSPTFVVRVE